MRSSRVLVVVGCVILALVFPLMVLSVDIGVVNGDFETSDDPIQGWTLAIGPSAELILGPHSGDSQVLHFTPSKDFTEYCQAVAITDPTWTQLEVSARVLAQEVVPGKVEVALLSSDSCVGAGGRILVVDIGEDVAEDVWTSVKRVVDLAGSPTHIGIFLSGEDNFLHFDDVSIEPVGATSVEMTGLRGSSGVWALVVLEVAVALVLIAGLSRKMG